VFLTILTFSVAIFPCFASSPANLDAEEQVEECHSKIVDLLDQINDDFGGSNLKVAQVKKYVDELVNLSDERTRYNIESAIARQQSRGKNIEDAYADCADLQNDALLNALYRLVNNHHSVGYREARHEMFSDLDNFDGYVTCVYTGRKLKTNSIPNSNNMNCEHTWPQSQGATGVARTDIHHLFCTDSKSNSVRSSLPFGWVKNSTWSQGGSCRGNGNFEVRKENRGNTARAKFYFALRYGKRIGSKEEATLRQWHAEDPVDEAELARNAGVEKIQKNRNPFVDRPEFVNQISDF
jgi:endonuclease I